LADFSWLDEFLAAGDRGRERALLRALTERLLEHVQAHTGVDWGPRLEHRCYEILNAPSTDIDPPLAPAAASGPYREPAPVTCARCGRPILAAESNVTETGSICDRCFAVL
jgi:hypothetical protein